MSGQFHGSSVLGGTSKHLGHAGFRPADIAEGVIRRGLEETKTVEIVSDATILLDVANIGQRPRKAAVDELLDALERLPLASEPGQDRLEALKASLMGMFGAHFPLAGLRNCPPLFLMLEVIRHLSSKVDGVAVDDDLGPVFA